MPSHNTYCLTWVSVTLDEGYLLTTTHPDLERGVAPLGLPVPTQPPLLGLGVAPLGRLPDLRCLVPLPAAAPDLGRGVAPLGRSCAIAAWPSQFSAITVFGCEPVSPKGIQEK